MKQSQRYIVCKVSLAAASSLRSTTSPYFSIASCGVKVVGRVMAKAQTEVARAVVMSCMTIVLEC